MFGYYEQIWRFSSVDPYSRSKFVDLNGLQRVLQENFYMIFWRNLWRPLRSNSDRPRKIFKFVHNNLTLVKKITVVSVAAELKKFINQSYYKIMISFGGHCSLNRRRRLLYVSVSYFCRHSGTVEIQFCICGLITWVNLQGLCI